MSPCVVIPAYNSEGKVYGVIKDVLQHQKLPVIVVDDGSNPRVELQNFGRPVEIKRFEHNRGKGAALSWAIKNLAPKYTHMITIDADGQHLAKDIEPLLEQARKEPQAIVIGARRFKENVPGISKFGRKFSNFWVWYQTGKKVADSQSGFRVYPLEELADISFFTKRYDFEIEVLVRYLWRNHPVAEVDIDVHYPTHEERVSHFDKLKDNARITFLNILLIAYSLLFHQKGLVKMILAALLGLCLSLLTGWTAPLILTILGSILLKLNFPLVLVVVIVLKIF